MQPRPDFLTGMDNGTEIYSHKARHSVASPRRFCSNDVTTKVDHGLSDGEESGEIGELGQERSA